MSKLVQFMWLFSVGYRFQKGVNAVSVVDDMNETAELAMVDEVEGPSIMCGSRYNLPSTNRRDKWVGGHVATCKKECARDPNCKAVNYEQERRSNNWCFGCKDLATRPEKAWGLVWKWEKINGQFFKAGGGKTCPAGTIIKSESDCRAAGPSFGYRYNRAVFSRAPVHRPPGCMWDQNGYSYFNKNFGDKANWGGVGGLCKGAAGAINCAGFKNKAQLPGNWCSRLGRWAICGIGDGLIFGPGYGCKFTAGKKGGCKKLGGSNECNRLAEA